jgi:uncharacterized protein YjbI with pentapeptide repeats
MIDSSAKSVNTFIDQRGTNMPMPRKSALLLHLLNLVLKPLSEQITMQSNQFVGLPQQPPTDDREAWHAYWKTQGQPWRTEPEIDALRQKELNECRAIIPDIKKGIYPFKGMNLSRADVEWLLATHESGGMYGPVDWSDENQLQRVGLDLSGADLHHINLSCLPLTRMRGGLRLTREEWFGVTPEQHEQAAVHLEGTDLREAHLEGAHLNRAHLERAGLNRAHLEGTDLREAHLEGAVLTYAHLEGKSIPADNLKQMRQKKENFSLILPPSDLRLAFFDAETNLHNATLGTKEQGFVSVADARWGNVNLAVVQWQGGSNHKELMNVVLGDERRARQPKDSKGKSKNTNRRIIEYEQAVRANRQLAAVLQAHGLNENAGYFTYRAQTLQKRVFWLLMFQDGVKLRQRIQMLGAWLFSWFLFLVAGYGYKMWRSFLAYTLVIIGFTMVYYLLGVPFKPSLSLVNALGLSMTSFHGRGFFPGVTQLNDTLTSLASLEAFVGLILEATFIATLTQRFFGK